MSARNLRKIRGNKVFDVAKDLGLLSENESNNDSDYDDDFDLASFYPNKNSNNEPKNNNKYSNNNSNNDSNSIPKKGKKNRKKKKKNKGKKKHNKGMTDEDFDRMLSEIKMDNNNDGNNEWNKYKLMTWNLWCIPVSSPRCLSNPDRCSSYLLDIAEKQEWQNYDGLIVLGIQELSHIVMHCTSRRDCNILLCNTSNLESIITIKSAHCDHIPFWFR